VSGCKTSVGDVMALSFKQRDRPTSYEQYDNWIRKALSGGDAIYMFSLATICWAIWKLETELVSRRNSLEILMK
jgi:hypothetical protein